MGTSKRVVIAIIAIVLVIIVATVVPLTYSYMTAEVTGRVEAEREIQSAEFRIYSYEHFYQKCAEIIAQENLYDAQYEELQMVEEGSFRYNNLATNLPVIKADIARLKLEYNADAAMEGTRGQFKAKNLVNYIEVKPHEYGNRTVCCEECGL